MRAFLSLKLPEALDSQIKRIQNQLAERVKKVRWIPAKNCHLTLKFLGEFPESKIKGLSEALMPVASQFNRFNLSFGRVGAFPKRGPISVVWIGVNCGESTLMTLENQIRSAMEYAKIAFDDKPFSPHITIGWAKRHDQVFLPSSIVNKQFSIDAFTVDAFYLMESTLHPKGAIYKERATFAFGG